MRGSKSLFLGAGNPPKGPESRWILDGPPRDEAPERASSLHLPWRTGNHAPRRRVRTRTPGTAIQSASPRIAQLVGNALGIAAGAALIAIGITQLNRFGIAAGLRTSGWALVPRYGFWSGPDWGKPTKDALGFWFGPVSGVNVIEEATFQHDRVAPEPGADRALIRDVWSRHDLGPYGQAYRLGVTGLFTLLIALGRDD